MKKNYITPCLLMLLPVILNLLVIYRASRMGAMGLMTRHHVVMPWIWLTLAIVDAVLYWSIRKTNIYRKDSLAHIALFSFGLFTPYLRDWFLEGYDDGFTFGASLGGFIQFMIAAQFFAFWISLVLGHFLFIRLLIKASSHKPNSPTDDADPRNLLDDVLT